MAKGKGPGDPLVEILGIYEQDKPLLSHAVKRLCKTNLASSLPRKRTARKIDFMVTSFSQIIKARS